jgi:hypothetical protein
LATIRFIPRKPAVNEFFLHNPLARKAYRQCVCGHVNTPTSLNGISTATPKNEQKPRFFGSRGNYSLRVTNSPDLSPSSEDAAVGWRAPGWVIQVVGLDLTRSRAGCKEKIRFSAKVVDSREDEAVAVRFAR